jgi:hypothetical protein
MDTRGVVVQCGPLAIMVTAQVPGPKADCPLPRRWLRSQQTPAAQAWELCANVARNNQSLLNPLTIAGMLSAQTGTAVLYATGSVYLNGAQLSNSSAVTAADVIQTKDTGASNVNAMGPPW